MYETLQHLFRFKAWANDELLTVLAKPDAERRITGLAIKALSHSYVVDRIFAAHMRRKTHSYTSANLSELPTLGTCQRTSEKVIRNISTTCPHLI